MFIKLSFSDKCNCTPPNVFSRTLYTQLVLTSKLASMKTFYVHAAETVVC